MPNLLARHRSIARQFATLAAEIASDERAHCRAPAVSAWSVAQHVDHLATTHSMILGRFGAVISGAGPPAPASAKGGPTWLGRLVLLTGYIPRGVGQAPRATRPPDDPAPREVRARLAATSALHHDLQPLLARIAASPERLPHPYFGALRFPDWLRFIEIHHHHHLKIVSDIRQAESGP